MKRTIVCYFFMLIGFLPMQTLKAQSPSINLLSETTSDLTGSFLDNPYHHENTEKVSEQTVNFLNDVINLYNHARYSDDPRVEMDKIMLSNMRNILKCLDFITASIAGYVRGGIKAQEFIDVMHPLFKSFGWEWNKIKVSPDNNLSFYEYRRDRFKMVLVRNMLPQKDGGDYNCCSYQCYTLNPKTKQLHMFVSRYVFGGDFQVVEWGDDKTNYNTITKITSKREEM